jgi:3-deoxy-manno-octulosonate cytidylyltransferase (CMP-KDO synthetase)
MDLSVIIPARLHARRYPGKPLASLLGQPLLYHVIARARAAWPLARVIVATDAVEIARALDAHAEVCFDPSPAACGTDRVARAAASLGLTTPWIINLQGDEPCVPPDALRAALTALQDHPLAALGTACLPMTLPHGFHDPDQVKVIADDLGFARYFSRAPIPSPPDDPSLPLRWLLHIGVYAFSPSSLAAFAAKPPSPLERTERLEQLRALQAGWSVAIHTLHHLTDHPWPSVNRPQDLLDAAAYLRRHSTQNPSGANG